MNKGIDIMKFFLPLFVIALVSISPTAIAADSYVVPNGGSTTINEHGVCMGIANNHATGNDILVPTKSANEWHTGGSSFLENLPANLLSSSPFVRQILW